MERTNFEQVLGKRKLTKKRIVIVIISLLCFLCLLYADGRQQYCYSIAKEAYEAMDAGRYREAYEKFELFKDSQSSFYWKFTEIFGEKKFRLGQIMESIAKCDEKLKNNSTTETLWLGSWKGTIPGSKSDRADRGSGAVYGRKKCWCVQLCDKENSRRFVSFQTGKVEMYIPLPDGAYCSGFCNMESDK